MTRRHAVEKRKQLEALSEGQAHELLEACRREMGSPSLSYGDIFTVDRKQLLEYLKSRYRFGAPWGAKGERDDGFHVVEGFWGFDCFYQERRVKLMQRRAVSKDAVWDLYVDYLLKTSGTGLPDSHWL